jgi:hypothetical protein
VISDGTFWQLTIAFADQKPPVEIDGHGAKPINFKDLLQLFVQDEKAAEAVMARYFG